MFVGHYGVGFALKKAAPTLSLGLLFFAAQFADILWPMLVILGIEKFTVIPGYTPGSSIQFLYYPYSHSLAAMLIWGILGFLFIAFVPTGIRGNRYLAGAVVAIAIFSHYVLDLIMHVPDLPLAGGGSPKIGLGLWHNYAASIAIELIFLLGGLWLYLRATRGHTFWARYSPAILTSALAIMEIAGSRSTPPNNPKMIAAFGLLLNFIIIALAFLVDRSRVPVSIKVLKNESFRDTKPIERTVQKYKMIP